MASLVSSSGKSSFTLPQEKTRRGRKANTGPGRRPETKEVDGGKKGERGGLDERQPKIILLGRPNYREENGIRWLSVILVGEF